MATEAISARAQRDNAREQARQATSLALSAASSLQLANHPATALLLAFEAYRTRPRAEARSALVAALSSPRFSPALVLAAAVVVAVGVALRTAARRALGADYSYIACAPGAVCTRGPYKYIRHPAYLGTCLYAFATPLGFASPAAALLVPLVLLAVLYRIRLEEALLEATRPAYAEYVRRTAALIPFVL